MDPVSSSDGDQDAFRLMPSRYHHCGGCSSPSPQVVSDINLRPLWLAATIEQSFGAEGRFDPLEISLDFPAERVKSGESLPSRMTVESPSDAPVVDSSCLVATG